MVNRSVDANFCLRMKAVDSNRKQRCLNFNADIKSLRLPTTEPEREENPACRKPEITQRKRKASQSKPAQAGVAYTLKGPGLECMRSSSWTYLV